MDTKLIAAAAVSLRPTERGWYLARHGNAPEGRALLQEAADLFDRLGDDKEREATDRILAELAGTRR